MREELWTVFSHWLLYYLSIIILYFTILFIAQDSSVTNILLDVKQKKKSEKWKETVIMNKWIEIIVNDQLEKSSET